jgi:type I restriction enzyme S subunit
MTKPWPTVRLGEVLRRSEENIELQPDAEYRQITVKLWGKGVVLRGILTGAEIASSRQMVARRGQFILSRIDARNGALGIVPPELDEAIVTNDFPVFNVVENRLLPTYLGWMCRTASFVEECKRASEGTTNRVRLQEDKFLAREIPLPPLAEQRRVVARIEELAANIDEARTLHLQAAEEAEALVLSTLKNLQLPRNTVEKPISACSTMSTGTTPPSDRSDYYGGPIQWYTPGDLEYQQQLGASSRTLSEVALAERKARMFEPGTVLLVAIGGSLGKVALTHERCSANQQITGIKFWDEVLPEYGFWWLRRIGKDLMAAAPQATLPIINQERIGAFEISVPPLAEQRRIVSELDALQAEVDALKRLQAETAAELDALLPAILHRAFKGEL